MRSAGWLMLLLGCSFQLLSLLCLARWREPPLAAAGPPGLPGGPDGPRLTRRLLQLRGVFVEPAGDSALSRALTSTGLPSSVDLRLAKIPPVAGKRRVLTAHSGEELRREVNLGLRSMWAAYATWAEVPEFEPRLAAALEAFGCRLALLPCATVPGMAAYCTERGFRRGWAGLLVTHPDSTGLQDVAAAFRPSADPSVVLARLSTRVSGLLAAWPPSGRSTAAAAGECGLLAELPGWPPAPPLMLAALSVEFQDRLRFWHRRLNDSTGSMRLVLLTPERRLSLAPADCGTPAALRLLLASVAPDAWQAGLAAAALLNFGLLPLPLLLPGTALPARCLAAVRMAAWCNLLLFAGAGAVRFFFSAAGASPAGLALASAWRHLVLSDLALQIRADWHLGAYPGTGLLAAACLICGLFWWHRPLLLEDSDEPAAGAAVEGFAGDARPVSQLAASVSGAAPLGQAAAGAASALPGEVAPGPIFEASDLDDSDVALGASGGSGSDDEEEDEEAAAARDAEAAQSLELFMESLAIPSLWIPQRDPERCLSRLLQWTCRVTPPAAPSDSTATATADTDVDAADSTGAGADDGWPSSALRSSHCSVCLDRFRRGHQLVGLLCGHVFHRGCAAGWLVRRSTCPVCRRCPYRLPAPTASA
ncbi:hypothetical protein BOX15_Mlig031573g2 [Macrostomum lignano]|uniref:RING-type domain-containing protein n=1 Tax=Macrostomum lignano TaxID=282301 RepID=A0A267FJH8_9PLAT|nr:hypothetical protein BOX15_Mlig031573g2 [Macrostomum lignano]